MKICFLSAVHTPLDKRVFGKEAVTLANHGFVVMHLAPAKRHASWVQDGVTLLTYPGPNHDRSYRRYARRLLALPRLYRLAAAEDADCYHCNELDSWLVGCMLKAFRRKTIVVDVHELYPAYLRERYPFLPTQLARSIVRAVYRVLTLFTDSIVLANRSIVSDFPRSTFPRQVVVENFASRAMTVRSQPGLLSRPDGDGSLVAITHGLIDRDRGWPQMLAALTLSYNSRLHVVGTFSDDSRSAFHARVSELDLSRRVFFDDWLPLNALQERLRQADVGLVLFQPGRPNHVHAMPHKLFDFMAAGLPVIVSTASIDIAELVRASDCGIVVDSTSPREIARALDFLAADPDERARLGENGRRAVDDRYNWETEGAKLVSLYRAYAMTRC